MWLKNSTEMCIYFGTNFIELKTIGKMSMPLSFISSKITLANLKNLNCPSLCHYSLNCQTNLFDIKKFMHSLNQNSKRNDDGNTQILSSALKMNRNLLLSQNNYLFYTQTDNAYYNKHNNNNYAITGSNNHQINCSLSSQVDSILDALENIGYYGFVTFRVKHYITLSN
jgi:hypothetical protein